jgi:hypothetical protein
MHVLRGCPSSQKLKFSNTTYYSKTFMWKNNLRYMFAYFLVGKTGLSAKLFLVTTSYFHEKHDTNILTMKMCRTTQFK